MHTFDSFEFASAECFSSVIKHDLLTWFQFPLYNLQHYYYCIVLCVMHSTACPLYSPISPQKIMIRQRLLLYLSRTEYKHLDELN